MIHSPETAKILVVLLLSLIVVSSTFSGEPSISVAVSAQESESDEIALTAADRGNTNRDDRMDLRLSEESNGSTTSIVPRSNDNTDTEAIKQAYHSLRSNAIQSELGITETTGDSDNGSSSPSNGPTSGGGDDNPTIQQSSSVGSFTVTRDLDILFSDGQTASEHLRYSGQVHLIPGGGWEATSLQGSCVNQSPLQTVSASPDHASVGYDSNTGTIILMVFPNTPIAVCAWPAALGEEDLPASIQNGMAVSSGSLSRPCEDPEGGVCTDSISWDVAVPLPPEVCPQGAPLTQSESSQDNVGVQQVANCPPTANAGPDQTVNEREDLDTRTTVRLAGSGFDADNDPLTFSWRADTPNAPTLSNTDVPNPKFTVPDVADDTSYTYTLTVSDGKSTSLADSVTINVIATKLDIDFDTDEITPKIGEVRFLANAFVRYPGDTRPITHTQPGIAGGDVKVLTNIVEGMTNPENVRIRFTFDPLIDTGGHDHLNVVNDDSRRAFGGFEDGRRLVIRLDERTDNTGSIIPTFRADNLANNRPSSAGGFIVIEATTIEPTMETLTDSEQLIIRVPGLIPLLDGAEYNLVGARPRHPDNHYGTEELVNALQEIAREYRALHPGQTLRYNDMSLVFGGVFDISERPRGGGDWRNPHLSHACGNDIDVGVNSVEGTRINFADFARIVSETYTGAFVIEEDRHRPNWHLHIHLDDC